MRFLRRRLRALKKKFQQHNESADHTRKKPLRARYFRTVIEILEDRIVPHAEPFIPESAFAPRIAVLGAAAHQNAIPEAGTPASQIVFVDGAVPNFGSLIGGLGANAEVIVLNPYSDGVLQITDVLRARSGLDSIQIYSHGASGQLLLGNSVLDDAMLGQDRLRITNWGDALNPDGDILLYGCDVARGPSGAQFVNRLAQATGADVVASTNRTGSTALGGDWNLEYATGPIETAFTAPIAYGSVLGFDLPTYIQDLLDSQSASFDISEPIIASANLGGFLEINGLTLTGHAELGGGGWSGTVILSAISAEFFPGTNFSAAITADAPGKAAMTGTFTIGTGAGYKLSAENFELKLGEALTVSASGVDLTYSPNGALDQTLVTIQTASVTSGQFADMPTAMLENFALRADGFSFDNVTLASAPGSNPGIGGFLSTSGVTLTASDFDVAFGNLFDSTPGAPAPSMTGTVGIAIDGLQLFPEGDFVTLSTSKVAAEYYFDNFNGTDPTGALTVTVSGFELKMGEALLLSAGGTDIVITPGKDTLATIDSLTLSSPKFANLGTVDVDDLEIRQSGFTLGNLNWNSSGAVSIGGDVLTMDSAGVTLSNFALDYSTSANESVTWAIGTNIVLANIPTDLANVFVTSTPSGGSAAVLTRGTDYNLVPGTGGDIQVVFTGHTPAVGEVIAISYRYASIGGSISFGATGVKLFPNVPVLNVTLGTLAGSFDFGNPDVPGQMTIHIEDLNIPLGDAITIGLGTVDLTPGAATMLHVTGAKISTNLFTGFSEITLPSLDITQTGFSLGNFTIPTASDISLGTFATFTNASLAVNDFKVDTSATPNVTGSITATLGTMTLFPGNPEVTSTVTGVTGTFDFGNATTPGRFTIHIDSFSMSLFSQVTLAASDITVTPALDTIATIDKASITFTALNSLALEVNGLAIRKDGFSIGSATVSNIPDLTLGSILTLTSPTVSLTNFDYARLQQTATEPTTWSSGTTIPLQHKPASLATVVVTSKIGNGAETALVRGTDYNLVTATGVTSIQFTGHAPVIGEVFTATYDYFGADTLKGVVSFGAGASSLNLGSAFNVSIAGTKANYDLATKVLQATLNDFSLDIAGFANVDILSASLEYSPAADKSAKMLLGATGVSAFFGVSGANPVGVSLDDGELALAVFKPSVGATTYALQASGVVSLTGLPADTLTFTSGLATFRKSTAGAVHEIISIDGTETNSIHLDFTGNETSAMGRGLKLSVGSFVSLSADFAFQTFDESGSTYVVVAANNVDATLAAGTVSLTVEGASLGLILKQGATGNPSTYAVVVNGGKNSLNGVPGFTLESNGLTVRVRNGLDVSTLTNIPASIATPPLTESTTDTFTWSGTDLVLSHVPGNFAEVVVTVTHAGGSATTLVQGTDYDLADDGSGNIEVHFTGYTPTTGDEITVDYSFETPQSVALDFDNLGTGTGNVTDIQGHVTIAVAGFASLEGDFGFQKFTAADKTVTLAIGATKVNAVLGTEQANVTISNATLGFLSQNGKFALVAGASAIALNGVDGLVLSTTDVSIRVRRGLDPATITGVPVIQTSGGDVTLDFSDLSAGTADITDIQGHVTLALDNIGSIEGDFGFQMYQDGATGAKQIAVGATNVTAIVGTDDVNLTVANASFGLVLRPGTGPTVPSTYALIARGSATPADTSLNGVTGIDLTASNLLVRVRKGLDLSASSGFPTAIQTSGGDVIPDFSGLGSGTTDVIDVQGAVSITVADFVTLQGEFGFQRYVIGTGVTAENYFAIGVHGGISAGTGTETLSLDDVSVGVLIKKPAVGAVEFALQAKGSSDPANTKFVGIDGLSLSASNLVVRVKRGLDLSTYPSGVPTTIMLPSPVQSTTDPDTVIGIPQVSLANTDVDEATVVVKVTPDGGTESTLTVGTDYTLNTNATTLITTVTFLAGHFPAAGTTIRISYQLNGETAVITDPDTIVPAADSILLVQTGVDRNSVVVTAAPAGSNTFAPVISSDYTLVTDAAGHVTLVFSAGHVPAEGTTVRIAYSYRSQPVTLTTSETINSDWSTEPTVTVQFIPVVSDAIVVTSTMAGIAAVRVLGTDYTLGTDASGHTTITFLAGHLPDDGTSAKAEYGYLFPQPMTLDFGDLGAGTADITDIQGHATFTVDGLASLEGDFGIQIYTPTGGTQKATFVIGGTNINAVLGSADTNLTISDAEFGLLTNNGKMALMAHGGTVALNGVPDLVLQADDLRVKVRKGLSPSSLVGLPTTVHTPGGEVTLDFTGLPAGDIIAIEGHAKIAVANFVNLEGDFSFTQAVTGTPGSQKTKILVGATKVNAFIGSEDKSLGVQISNASLALFIIKDQAVAGSKYAIQASAAVEVVGLPTGVTLTGTATVAINTTGSTAVNSEVIPNAPAFQFTSGNVQSFGGHLTFAVDSAFSLEGDFSFTKSVSGKIAKTLIGATNIKTAAGSSVSPSAGSNFAMIDGRLGVVLYRDNSTKINLGYALSASATAVATAGGSVTAGATVNIRRNTTTSAHNDTVIVGSTTIPVVFSAVEVQNNSTNPAKPFQSISLSDAKLVIDNTIEIIAGTAGFTQVPAGSKTTALTGVSLKLVDPGSGNALFTISAGSAAYTIYSGTVSPLLALNSGLSARGTKTLTEGAINGDYTLSVNGTTNVVTVNFNTNKTPSLNTMLRVSYELTGVPGIHYDDVIVAGANQTSIALDLTGVDLTTVLVTATAGNAAAWQSGDVSLYLFDVAFTIGTYVSFYADTVDLQHFGPVGSVVNRFNFTGAEVAFLNDGTPMASITGNATFTFTTGQAAPAQNGFNMESFTVTDYSFLGQTAELAAGTSPPPVSPPPGGSPPPPPPPPGTPPPANTTRTLGPLTLGTPTIAFSGFTFEPSGKLGALITIGATSATVQAGGIATAKFTNLTGTFEIGAEFNLSSPFSPPANPFVEFKSIQASGVEIKLGDYVTLSTGKVVVKPNAGANEDLIAFDSIAAKVDIGSLHITGSASKFAIQGDGKFVAKTGFGVSVSVAANDSSSTSSALGVPGFITLEQLKIDLKWANFNSNPDQFLIQLSAGVSGIGGGKLPVNVSGSIQNMVIDPQLVAIGAMPIISIDGAAVSVSGNLFGGEVSGTLIFGVVRYDINGDVVDGFGNLVNKPTITPGVAPFKSAFYTGIAGSIDIAGTLSFSIRIGISQLGLLQVYVEAGVPVPLGPTGLFLSDFRGGITFDTTFPDLNLSDPPTADDALKLRQPAFTTPDKLTAPQWEAQLRTQVARQIRNSPNGEFQAPSTQFLIQAGATIYAVNENAFRVDGDIIIDTSGKILILGSGTFGNNLTVGVKMFTDLSEVFAHTSNSASVLFLMESPALPNDLNLPPTYSVFGVLTITDLPDAFKISVAGAMEYQVLGALKARVQGTVTLTFTSDSFKIELSNGHFFIYAIQASSLGDAAGSITLHKTATGDFEMWGGFLLVPNVAFLEPFGLHVGGQFFVKVNTSDELKTVTVSLGGANGTKDLTLEPQSFSLLLVGHADFMISGATAFRLDGTLAVEIKQDHLSIFTAATLLLGPDPAAPVMTFNANGLVYVQIEDTLLLDPGFAAKLTLTTGLDIPNGARFSTNWVLVANTTNGDVTYTIPTPIPTTPPSPPIATVLGPDYLSSNPLALTSYEVLNGNDRTLVVPRGSPPNGLTNYKTWVPFVANDYFVVLGRGSITIADTIVMTGNMNILGTLSGSTFRYTLQEDATLAIKVNGNTVFSFGVAGAVELGNDGVAAALAVTLTSAIPSNLGFTLNAGFVLELNTTGQEKQFFVPNVGAIVIPGDQIVLVHANGHLKMLGNVLDFYGDFDFTVTTTSLTMAMDADITFLNATFHAAGFAGLYYDSRPGVAMRISLGLPGGAKGIAPISAIGNKFVISGAFALELNSSSIARPDQNNVNIAPGFKVSVQNLGVNLYGFNLTGSISVGISNAGFDFDVNLSLNLFNCATISVTGYYHHSGIYRFTGSAGFQFGDHTFGVGGTVTLTVANNLFSFGVSGWAAAFGYEIGASGSITITGTSVDITIRFYILLFPAVDIDTPALVIFGETIIPAVHIHTPAQYFDQSATFHLGTASNPPVVAQVIPPKPPPTPPHLAGFVPNTYGANTLVLFLGQDVGYRLNSDNPPVLTPAQPAEAYTLTRLSGDPNSTLGQTIVVSALNFQQTYTNVLSILVTNTLAGNDTIILDSGITVPFTITVGSGNNIVNTGSGPATVTITGGGSNQIVTGSSSKITVQEGATGSNQITTGDNSTVTVSAASPGSNQISAGSTATITLAGTANNSATLSSGTSATSTVTISGTGKNAVNVTGGSPVITVTDKATNSNTVTMNTSFANSVTIDGSGNNVVTSFGSGASMFTVNGNGSNQITTGSGTASVLLIGSGNNIVTTGVGVATVFDRGIGSNTITGGKGGGTLYYGTTGPNGSGAAYTVKGNSILSTAFGNFAVIASGYSTYQLSDNALKAGNFFLNLNGVKQVTLNAAVDVANTFTLYAWSGNATLNGVGTNNTLFHAPKPGVNSVNDTLSDTTLQIVGGVTQTITLNSIQTANLVGATVGANTFNVTAWTGNGSLAGPAGTTNTLIAVNDVTHFFLSETLLQRTGHGDLKLSGIQTANLTGGSSPNIFTVSNWSGVANLNGQEGGDTYNLTLSGTGTGTINIADTGSAGTDKLNVTASGTTLVTSTSVRVGTQRANYGQNGIEELNVFGGSNGLTYNVQSTNAAIAATTIQPIGDGNAITVSSTAGIVPATAGNVSGILGKLAVNVGTGVNNVLRVSDLGGTADKTVTFTDSSISGFAPADIHYSVTSGNFTSSTLDGIRLEGANAATLLFNILSTLLGSSAKIIGGSLNDVFHVGTAANSLGLIRGPLSIEGLANSATPTTTLNAGSVPASLSSSHTLAVGDIVNFNDQGDAGGYTYGLTGNTLDRTSLPQILFDNFETVNVNTAFASSTINVLNTTANANTTVIGSLNATPTSNAFNITGTGANSNTTFFAGTGDTSFNLQSTGPGSFNRIIGKSGNDAILVSSNAIAGSRGNVDSVFGTLSIEMAGGDNNRLTFDDFTGSLPNDNVVINSDAITGLAPAIIFYAATGGHYLNPNPTSYDGIAVHGADTHASTFNVQSTLFGSSLLVEGGSLNDAMNVGTVVNSLSQIQGQLAIDGLANSAIPTTTLSASSVPAGIAVSQTLPVGDIVYFNDHGDASGYTYDFTSKTLNRTGLPQAVPAIKYGNLETINLNASLAPSTINVTNTLAYANTTITGSPNNTPTSNTFNIQFTGANSHSTFIAGSGDTAFNLQNTGPDSFNRIIGKNGNDTILVSSNAIAGTRGNIDSILGTLAIDAGTGDHNRLTFDDFSGIPIADAVIDRDAITGLAPANIYYSATGGHFLNPNAAMPDGLRILGTDAGADRFQVHSTLGGSTTWIDGAGADDSFNVSSNANTLSEILGDLTIQGGNGSANLLIVSDFGNTNSTTARSNVIQTAVDIGGTQFQQLRNFAGNTSGGSGPVVINYVATGGGFNHENLEDGVLLVGSNLLSSTFNLRTTLGGSTTKILGGNAADYFVISSTANINGDPGTSVGPNGTLDGIAGNLTIDAGSSATNRLVINDRGQIATPKSNVIQVETTIGATTYEQLQNFVGNGNPKLNYVASGGGFNHVTGPTEFGDGILVIGSQLTSSTFTLRNTLGGSTMMLQGGQSNDNFFIGSPTPGATLAGNPADNGNLDLIRGQVAVVGNGGSDALAVNDSGNGATPNRSHAFNYLVTPTRIANDPTPVKTVPNITNPPVRTFATNGVIYNASSNASQNSVSTLRVDGSDDVNIFSVTPSPLTTYTIDGNLTPSGIPIPGGGDYLKLNTTHFADGIGGRKLHINTVGNGFWAFASKPAAMPVNFLNIERFNHVEVTAAVETLPNQSPVVVVRDSETGAIKFQVQPYPGITGTASVAVGDLNSDGIPDLAVTPGANLPAVVTLFNGTPDANGNYPHAKITSFPAFATAFRTGISLAIGDLNADGANELLAGAGAGSGGGYQPTVQVFDGKTVLTGVPSAAPPQLPSAPFLAFEPSFIGGINVSVGDLNNDGRDDVIVTRQSGPATVNVFSYPASAFTLVRSFTAYTPAVNGGLANAIGDYNGDGWNDIILGSGPGGSPAVMVYQGGANLFSTSPTAPPLMQLLAQTPFTFTGGVLVQSTPIRGGDPGTIEQAFITAQLQGTASFFEYSAAPGVSQPGPIQPTLPAGPATSPVLVGSSNYAVGAGVGGSAIVSEYDPSGLKVHTYDPFPGTTGGVRTAVGDFNNDGTPDVALGTGPGTIAGVKVFDGKTGSLMFNIQPFESFTGGVFVAVGDITGDGHSELVITPDLGGGPRARIFSGNGFTQIADFFGIDDPNYRGGARAGVGDLNGDGHGDLVVSAGFGGGPRLAIYDGKSLSNGQRIKPVQDFFLFEPQLRNGVYVAVGDVNGDGFADIIGGAGPGGGPRVLVISGQTLLSAGAAAAIRAPVANFFAGDVENRGGIRVAAKDLDGDPKADIVTGSGEGGGSRVSGYLGKDFTNGPAFDAMNFDAFADFTGGVFVG
jgi:hypothetical protein